VIPEVFINSPASMKKGMATKVEISTPLTMVEARIFKETCPRIRM
jgi:hypothetical protein